VVTIPLQRLARRFRVRPLKLNIFMPNKNESELEHFLRRELGRLPDRKAPGTLAPRVLAAIEAKARKSWWQQSFWAWPVAAQTSFVVLLATAAGFLVRLAWMFGGTLSAGASGQSMERVWRLYSSFSEVLVTLGGAISLVLRSVAQPWVWGALAVSFLMYLCCVAAGTVFMRLAWKNN
jgi:hypothetical protein